MGLLDDIEAAERTEREPLKSRLLRRIGGGLAAAGVLMCLLGIFGGRWWSLEFDHGPITIGLSRVEYCDRSGKDCEEISAWEFSKYAATRSGGEKEDRQRIYDWLGKRQFARYALGMMLVVCVMFALIALAPRRHKRTRGIAATAGATGLIALYLTWSFAWTTPFDLLTRGVHAYIALAGVLDLVIGAALAAIPSAHVALPTAKVVARG